MWVSPHICIPPAVPAKGVQALVAHRFQTLPQDGAQPVLWGPPGFTCSRDGSSVQVVAREAPTRAEQARSSAGALAASAKLLLTGKAPGLEAPARLPGLSHNRVPVGKENYGVITLAIGAGEACCPAGFINDPESSSFVCAVSVWPRRGASEGACPSPGQRDPSQERCFI